MQQSEETHSVRSFHGDWVIFVALETHVLTKDFEFSMDLLIFFSCVRFCNACFFCKFPTLQFDDSSSFRQKRRNGCKASTIGLDASLAKTYRSSLG